MHLALSLPRVEAVDLRPWVPPEHALVISSEHTNPDGSYRAAQEAKTVAWPPPSNSPAHLMKPSFLTVELTAQQSLSRQKVCLCMRLKLILSTVAVAVQQSLMQMQSMTLQWDQNQDCLIVSQGRRQAVHLSSPPSSSVHC